MKLADITQFETAIIRKIYSKEDGHHIAVQEDADGLRCVEVFYVEDRLANPPRLTFLPEQARLVAKAMLQLADELDTPVNRITALAGHLK